MERIEREWREKRHKVSIFFTLLLLFLSAPFPFLSLSCCAPSVSSLFLFSSLKKRVKGEKKRGDTFFSIPSHSIPSHSSLLSHTHDETKALDKLQTQLYRLHIQLQTSSIIQTTPYTQLKQTPTPDYRHQTTQLTFPPFQPSLQVGCDLGGELWGRVVKFLLNIYIMFALLSCLLCCPLNVR